MPDDPVTDTSRILDVSQVVGTSAVTAPATPGGSKGPAPAKPSISTLFLYDAADSRIATPAASVQAAYYAGATVKGVNSWAELTAALANYSTIETLIVFVHSDGGQMIFAGDNPTADDIAERFAKSAVKVSKAIRFEGCNIMCDPATTAQMVARIAEPGAVVSGYTYYSIIMDVNINVPTGTPPEAVQKTLDSYAGYWFPGTPKAAEIAASEGDTRLWVRYFRDVFDEAKLPPRGPDGLPPKGFVALSSLEPRSVSSREQADQLQAEMDQPVHAAAIVTVRDIAAVAGKAPAGAIP